MYSVFGMLCLGVLSMTVGRMANLISAICWLSVAWGMLSLAQGEAWGAHSKDELHQRSMVYQDGSSLSIGVLRVFTCRIHG